MSCYQPLKCYKLPNTGVYNDYSSIKYKHSNHFDYKPGAYSFNASVALKYGIVQYNAKLPCGKCLGCLKKRRTDWYLRCLHESYEYDTSVVITLTYNDDSLGDPSLEYRDYQLFMKRLRKKFSNIKIRFFCCGEYGSKRGRKHWHAILYNCDFEDKIIHEKKEKYTLYRSQILADLWGKGFVTFGYFNASSCHYATKYIVKAVYEKKKYSSENKLPPMIRMSTNGGLGIHYLKRYMEQLKIGYKVMVGKVKYGLPKFYLKKLKDYDPVWYSDWLEKMYFYFKGKETNLDNLKIKLTREYDIMYNAN